MEPIKLTADDAPDWTGVGDEAIEVKDILDQGVEPGAKMTVGYARLGDEAGMEISFPYDEVLVITRGTYVVRLSSGETLEAGPGETIYLPAGSRSYGFAKGDVEMAYVASPPSVYADHVAASA